MLHLTLHTTNPFFNLAAEEYLLKQFKDDIFVVYRNEPSVIVGKHQNALDELNLDYARKHSIKVVRRLSGGGAVYHDLGNINFTLIKNGEPERLVNLRQFTEPIIQALRGMGVAAEVGAHSSLIVNGLKISGNAVHVFRSRALHHGTLLFDSDLHRLTELLHVSSRYEHRAVRSVRAAVTNIKSYLPEPFTTSQFMSSIQESIVRQFPHSQPYVLTDEDHVAINQLATQKYSTWEWVFGYSPSYSLQRDLKTEDGDVTLTIRVQKGVIVAVHPTDRAWCRHSSIAPILGLVGCRHRDDAMVDGLTARGMPIEKAVSTSRILL